MPATMPVEHGRVVSSTPSVPSVELPVPAGTPVRAVTSGTVVYVRYSPTNPTPGLTVVLRGDDGATYTYSHLVKALVKPNTLVTTGERIGTSGQSGITGLGGQSIPELGFQIQVPDVSGTVCPQSAFAAWASGLDIDVRALPSAGCVTSTDPAHPLQRVLVVQDSNTAGLSAPLATLLGADHVKVSTLQLTQPNMTLASAPGLPFNWAESVEAAVKADQPDLVIMALGQTSDSLSATGPSSVTGLLHLLPAGQQVLWLEPVSPDPAIPTTTTSHGPAPSYVKALTSVDATLTKAVAADHDLRVANMDDLMAEHPSWLSGADTAYSSRGIQGLSGGLYAYTATSYRLVGATRLAWATAFADQLSAPSLAAIKFVMAWTTQEGAEPAHNNPLNTTEPAPGAKLLAGNPDGVKTYSSLLTGLATNLSVIERNGDYGAIVAELQKGNVTAAAAALEASPWCVGANGGECPGYGQGIMDVFRTYANATTFDLAANEAVGTNAVPGYGLPVMNESFLPVDQFLAAQLGKPYLWGGAGPDGWDCSGLVMAAYAKVGLVFEHNAAAQYQETKSTQVKGGFSALRPGDLVFYAYNASDPASIHHVAVYVGNGEVLDAPYTGTVVQIQPIWSNGFFAATRPLNLLKSSSGGPLRA